MGGAALLGAALAFATGICSNSKAIAVAQALGNAGKPMAAVGMIVIMAAGTFLGLMGVSYLWDAFLVHVHIGTWRMRIAGAIFVALAVAIALGRVMG